MSDTVVRAKNNISLMSAYPLERILEQVLDYGSDIEKYVISSFYLTYHNAHQITPNSRSAALKVVTGIADRPPKSAQNIKPKSVKETLKDFPFPDIKKDFPDMKKHARKAATNKKREKKNELDHEE